MNKLITWIQEQLGSAAIKEDAQAVFDYLRDKIAYDQPGNLILVDDSIDLKAALVAATGSKNQPTQGH